MSLFSFSVDHCRGGFLEMIHGFGLGSNPFDDLGRFYDLDIQISALGFYSLLQSCHIHLLFSCFHLISVMNLQLEQMMYVLIYYCFRKLFLLNHYLHHYLIDLFKDFQMTPHWVGRSLVIMILFYHRVFNVFSLCVSFSRLQVLLIKNLCVF